MVAYFPGYFVKNNDIDPKQESQRAYGTAVHVAVVPFIEIPLCHKNKILQK